MKYTCIICNYSSKIKCNYQKHLKTKKHIKNSKKNVSVKYFSCECGKTYKTFADINMQKQKIKYTK